MRGNLWTQASCLAVASCFAWAPTPSFAQSSTAQIEEVVVTARKRQESDISVPVSVSTLGAQQIERQAVLNMFDVASRVPTLSINNNTSSVGGAIFLRGIGTQAIVSATIEQSVSTSIDGAPISRGNVLRIGQYDLEQIEILKGPQALFFGKNSPAGVISLKSKDPTSEFELMGKLSYEPYANNKFAEGVISGPLTDKFRARVFFHIGKSDGDKDNLSALALPANAIRPGAVMANPREHAWGYQEDFIRGTFIFEPNERFKARVTTSYDHLNAQGSGVFRERYNCPQGAPQTATVAAALSGGPNPALAKALAVDDCKLNQTVFNGGASPAFESAPQSITRDPEGADHNRTAISVAEINYELSDRINLTSVSAYSRIHDGNVDHITWQPATAAPFSFYQYVHTTQFSQEVRATSHFDFPVNFMVGGFYQDADIDTYASNTGLPTTNVFNYHVPNQVYSAFGQVLWDITPKLELAAGARFTEEKKELDLTLDGVRQPTANPNVTFYNTSPEATLTWRPTSDLTTYFAYKNGFKSGGYASTISGNGGPLPASPLRDFLYNPESAKGFEGGVKAALLNRTLRIDTTIYRYEYANLQVSRAEFTTGGVGIIRVSNAAAAVQRGIEVEATYYPSQISGLRLNGMANYNKSDYSAFISPCWIGQSIAEGCNIAPVGAGGAFTAQDLKGVRFTNAPLWVGAAGFTYDRPIGNMNLQFGADVVYRGSYSVTVDNNPGGAQKAYTTLNGQIRLMAENRSWEFGIYGKNLTNVQRALDNSSVPLTGNATATGTINGGLLARPDLAGSTNPGRAVFFQLVLRPSVWLAH